LRLVLDTNEFIGALGIIKHAASEILLTRLLALCPKHIVYLPRIIINEVQRNISSSLFSEFLKIIRPIAKIDEDILVPFEIGAKYERLGLKSADAFIAAYTEWVQADLLVSENRHFLSRQNDLSFKVLTAEKCLITALSSTGSARG
jgi:predicted nucleic acid-binding protein